VPRNGYNKFSPLVLRNFFPKHGKVLTHGIQLSSNYYFDEKFNRTDNQSILSYILTFRNKAVLTVSGINEYIRLLRPFDPTNTGAVQLPIGHENNFNSIQAQFVSKPQSVFTYLLEGIAGGYYNSGRRISTTAQIGYRFQPYVNIAINANYIDLDLPAPYHHYQFWLVGPRVDVTFTKTLYFTTFVQYNEQIKNLNVNTRLQWRYKPASDLFIVYSDNYDPGPFATKGRQLVLKWTYWWNL
ncbi:MAG: hydrolase, partial [Flavitalea sp.]